MSECPYCGSSNVVENEKYFCDLGIEWLVNYCQDCEGTFDDNTGNVRPLATRVKKDE